MADSRFSSKHQDQKSSMMRRIVGSLGLRVFFVCLVLLILPLLLHTFFIYTQEYRFRMRDLFDSLQAIGEAKSAEIEERLQFQIDNLDAFTLLLGLEKGNALPPSPILKQISDIEGLTSLFYLTPTSDGSLVYTASSQEEMVGKPAPLSEQFQKGLGEGGAFFLGEDPRTGVKEFYIAKNVYSSTDHTLLGILGISFPGRSWLDYLSKEKSLPYSYTLFLLSSDGQVYLTNSSTPLSSVELFSDASIKSEKNFPFFYLFKTHKKSIGVQIALQPQRSMDNRETIPLYLVIALPKQEIFKVPTHRVLLHLSTLLLFILVVGGAGTLLITRRMARPLKSLAQLMEKVEEGDLSVRYHKDRMGFEINLLGNNFNRMIEALLTHMQEAKNARIGRELLEKELKIGYDIQKSLLPRQIPEFPGLDIAAGFIAAKEVTGDFYDLFVKKQKEGDQLMVAIADASGKGISACLYSLCMRSMLRSYGTFPTDLAEAIRLTNNLFCLDTGESGNFVTAWIGQYDPQSHLLHYSSCGHLPAIVRRQNGAIEELTTINGTALGAVIFDRVSVNSTQLFPGDQLILYTDGVLEAQDALNQFYGKERLFELLRVGGEESAQVLVDRILSSVAHFSKDVPQHDDLTLLVIRII